MTKEEILAEMAEFRARAEAEFVRERQQVAQARVDCIDKEPFSVEGLERELNVLGETTLALSSRELEQAEHRYYLLHRDMTALAELAEAIALNYPSRPSAEAIEHAVEERKREAPHKEPFSQETLRQALGPRGEIMDGLSPAQLEWYELSYYLHYPAKSTLSEFSATLTGDLRRRRGQ